MSLSLSPEKIHAFRNEVWEHYAREGRNSLPWRLTRDPYCILVSEIMLQQTQVTRVVKKYREFISAFPDARSLAGAALDDVLRVWSGLGYNRRALMLKRAAEEIAIRFGGETPEDMDALRSLPGIGPYTAGAVLAFAFNRPEVFIETNIRTVFIHHFFSGTDSVHDSAILPLVEITLDRDDPRRWYWALMDYGASLKSAVRNSTRRSAHYTRQAAFHGSDRQIRGSIIRILLAEGGNTESGLREKLGVEKSRFRQVIEGLIKDGMISYDGENMKIA